jgi:hypothetical protein
MIPGQTSSQRSSSYGKPVHLGCPVAERRTLMYRELHFRDGWAKTALACHLLKNFAGLPPLSPIFEREFRSNEYAAQLCRRFTVMVGALEL